MCFVHFVLQTRAFCQFTFDKVTNEVPALRSGPNECASPNEMTVISFGPERKCFAERKCLAAKRFARTLGRMAVTKDQARPGPGLARPAPPAGSGGAKKQKTEARGRKGGPHWSPVEILVGGRQPEPPNATVCLLPCCGQRSPPFTQCVTPHVLRQLRWLVCSSTNASSRSYPLLTYLRPQSAHGQRAPKALSKLLSAEEQGIVSFSSATATLL